MYVPYPTIASRLLLAQDRPAAALAVILIASCFAHGSKAAEPAAKPPAASAKAESEEWVQLFNGKDLKDWTPKIMGHPAGENYGNTFRIVDGKLCVVYDEDKYPTFDRRFGHLFYKQPYSHYRLRVEYRFVGDQAPEGPNWAFRNSGIMIHGESPETMTLEQEFPVSIEVQLLGGRAEGDRATANLCTPGTHVVMNDKLLTQHCTNSISETYRGDDWVTVELEVHGNGLIKHILNGETVLSYTQSQYDESDPHAKELAAKHGVQISGGTISLQSESHPVEFRKVELLPLKE